MTKHMDPNHPSTSETEPVIVADIVKAVAAVAAGLGWTIPNSVISAVITLVGAALFIYSSVWTRKTVTSPATLARVYTRFQKGRLRDDETDTP